MPRVDWRVRTFWQNVLMTDTCWLYTKSINDSGYGILTDMQRAKTGERRAHRHSYVLFNGPVPEGLQINHHCDVRNCVRPDHLYAGTAKDNTQDAIRRNRGVGPRPKPLCPYGHTKVTSGGRLVCQECRNRRAREKARRFIPRERWRKDA